jgi:flagellar assembly factor FliW
VESIVVPVLETKSLGTLIYQQADVIRFPLGLAGFEDRRNFLAVERPESHPLVFLQSIDQPDLFFVTVPVRRVDPAYELLVLDEYRTILGITDVSSTELLSLAIVCLPQSGPATANLLGPLVIHCPTGQAVQAIRDDQRYSATHPLLLEGNECS